MTGLRLQTLSDQASLRAIAPEWDALVAMTHPRPLPLTHAWLAAWTKNFADHGALRVACVYEGEHLAAIAPMARRICRIRGLRVTCRESMSNGATPFSGLILHPALEKSRLVELFALLAGESSEDVMIFHRLPVQGSAYAALLEYLPKAGRCSAIRPSISTPVIDANEPWPEYLEKRSKKFRKGLRNKLNRFERMGLQIAREVIDSRSHPSVDQMVSVSSRSWKAGIGTDLAADQRSREFLFDLIDAFGRAPGAVQLFVARDGEAPIAFELQVVLDGTVYPLRADFDARYEECSPGAVVEAAALKWLFETASAHRYYSCADNYRYLSHWTDVRQAHADVELYRRGVKPYLLYALEHRLISLVKSMGPFDRIPHLRPMSLRQNNMKHEGAK